MVRNTRNNDSQSSLSDPPMAYATLEVTSQQNPQVTSTAGVSRTEPLGATMISDFLLLLLYILH